MKSLLECREVLNALDPKIKELFIQRMYTVKDVALYKKDNDLPIFDESREESMIERLSSNIDEELKPYYLEFLKAILKISKDYQKDLIDKLNN